MATYLVLSAFSGAPPLLQIREVRGLLAMGAHIIVLNSDKISSETRSSRRRRHPRGQLLARCHTRQDRPARIPIGKAGIKQIQIVQVGDGLQFTIELDDARSLTASKIGDSAILLDLLPIDGKPDETLPTAEHIEAWLSGVSLSRMASQTPRDRKLIIVDPGHGGFDHGAIGTQGTREADIALEISRRTAKLLESRLDVDVIMTRDRDIFIPLRDRAALANRENADLFLSIHANAAPNNYAKGIETYSLASASDANAARVAARENAMAKGWSDSLTPSAGGRNPPVSRAGL